MAKFITWPCNKLVIFISATAHPITFCGNQKDLCIYLNKLISNLKQFSTNSRFNVQLKYLNPFLDQDGLLRVAGCLTNSNLNYDQLHQIISSLSNNLVNFIYYHKTDLHIDKQGLLNNI